MADPWAEFRTPEANAAALVRNDPAPVTTQRAPVPSTSRTWGDAEAEQAGLYEPSSPQADPWAAFRQQPPQQSYQQQGPNGVPRLMVSPVNERFVPIDEPANGDELRRGLEQRAAEMTMGTRQNPITQQATGFENIRAAASQGTNPNVERYDGNLISNEAFESETGEVLYRDPADGKLKQTDTATQVAIRDPRDGNVKIFSRTPETDEGNAVGLSRVLVSGMATGAPTARLNAAVKPLQSVGNPVIESAGRLGLDVPRAISSDNTIIQRAGQGIRNIPIVGDSIPRATQSLTEGLGRSVSSSADSFGAGSGPNVASRIGRNIQAAGESEAANAANAARRSDQIVAGAWERNQENAISSIAAREGATLTTATRAVGNMSPQEMGATLIARLRTGEQEARQLKESLYGVAGNSDASISAGAVREVRGRIAQTLENDGWRIEPVLTPAASRMMDELTNLSNLQIPNRAVGARLPSSGEGEIAAINMHGIESTRKVLNRLSQAATNDADRAAARHIIRGFDDWLSESFDNALFSGSDEALDAYRSARTANADWRTRFGFNARDDADRIVNQIVTGAVTPQEVSNWIVGATKVGSKGVSSRLLTRIAEATGGDPEAAAAIRSGIWNRLTSATDGVDAKASGKVANDIAEFLNGSGSDVANRLFDPVQRRLMAAYGDTLRRGTEARNIVAEVGENTKPSAMSVGPGPMEQLAASVLGKSGKTDEALFSAIDAYAKSGGRGDIVTLSGILKAIPQSDRGDLAGAIVRKLGVSPRTGEFSPDVFASQWKSYTPQAKALLFGNAGPQRQALDDILIISERLKRVGQRFGNPSGTAQNVNMLAMASAAIAAPLTTMVSAVGGAALAKILSSPAGAASAAQWTRAYAAFAAQRNFRTIAALQIASRNLANTAEGVGVTVLPGEFLKAIQSPMKSAPEEEQPPVPRGPGQ